MTRHKTPITVLGGFLGAGKTTALNTLLADPSFDAHGLWVMVNDFGAVNVDAALLRERLGGRPLLALANGCVCCAVGNDFMSALDAAAASATPPTRVLLEASGVGLPRKIMQAAWACGYAPDATVVIASAHELPRQLQDAYVAETVRAQLASADITLLNGGAELNEAAWQAVEALIERQHRFDARRDSIAALLSNPRVPAMQAWQPRTLRAEVPPFQSVTLVPRQFVSVDALRAALRAALPHALRIKGFVNLRDGAHVLVNAHPGRIDLTPWAALADPTLVLIAHRNQDLALAQSPLMP